SRSLACNQHRGPPRRGQAAPPPPWQTTFTHHRALDRIARSAPPPRRRRRPAAQARALDPHRHLLARPQPRLSPAPAAPRSAPPSPFILSVSAFSIRHARREKFLGVKIFPPPGEHWSRSRSHQKLCSQSKKFRLV